MNQLKMDEVQEHARRIRFLADIFCHFQQSVQWDYTSPRII